MGSTDGYSRCGRKTALSVFFVLSLISFVFCLLGLISPTWQYANLENGRTEHHHGLWLDCKRDYSFDYGRTREYYETLYRRDMQGSPFDVFFLPKLQCVYKFDYYIDPEDLYDHNHDENRIQNDAYQHLFLGWKIAALVGVGVGVLFSGGVLILGICSFCHRTFICASTVLMTISAILSTIGVAIFYVFANYQDNKVIKEVEEGVIYEQTLGWAFYSHVIGCCLSWVCSLMGCCATSISFTKQRAKLVKIEVIDGDQSELLSQPFKRSFSAIYRVDSSALRQWEKGYLRQSQHFSSTTSNFKRTASVPNMTKAQKKALRRSMRSNQDLFSSSSNITQETTSGSNFTISSQSNIPEQPTALPVAPPKLKSALKTPQMARKEIVEDQTYDYLACESIGVSTFVGNRTPTSMSQQYDEVYEKLPEEYYLQPNSMKTSMSTVSEAEVAPLATSSQSIPLPARQTTVIDDKAATRPTSLLEPKFRLRETTFMEERTKVAMRPKFTNPEALPVPPPKPLSIRSFGIDMTKESTGSCEIQRPPPPPLADKPKVPPRPDKSLDDSFNDLPAPPEIALNTFAERKKSVTNLSFIGVPRSSAAQLFERPDSAATATSDRRPPTSLSQKKHLNALPDEVERSIGNSTVFENDLKESSVSSYAKDAEVRLNLFMKSKDRPAHDETTV